MQGEILIQFAKALPMSYIYMQEDVMLSEITDPRQIPGEGRRRWFADTYFDLIVWYEGEGPTIAGFQLCYDKGKEERALTWRRDAGFDHKRIDDGEVSGRMKMTPVLIPDGSFDYKVIADRFLRESEAIDPGIRQAVYNRLTNYSQNEP
jgi:hypothetical protein